MKLRRLSFRGITRFTSAEPIVIYFESLSGGLIAITGDNGSGKTTTMEAAAAALYKSFPSRPGSIYDHAHGRDAFIEATFSDDGREIKVRLQVDAERRTTEGYVFLDGAPVTTGRAAEFEAEVERRFGSQALFLSSVFAAQDKSGSFLLMKKVERKSLFVELLGLAHLEVLAQAARERETAARANLDRARQLKADAEAELTGLLDAQINLDAATVEADTAAGALDAARQEEASALAQLERARGAAERVEALRRAEQAAERELAAAQKALAEANALPAKSQRQADEALRSLAARRVEDLEPAARRRHHSAVTGIEDRCMRLNAQIAQAGDPGEARAALDQVRSEIAAHEAEARRLDALRADLRLADAGRQAAGQALSAAQVARVREIGRLERQAGLLAQAPCAVQSAWLPVGGGAVDLAGSCPLLADARLAQGGLEALRDAGPLAEEAALEAAEARLLAAQQALLDAPATHDVVTQAQILRQREIAAQQACGRAEAAIHAREQLAALDTERQAAEGALERELVEARGRALDAAAERGRIEDARAEALMEADERIRQAEAGDVAAQIRHKEARAALAAERDVASLATAQAAHRDAEVLRREAEALLAEAITRRAGIEAAVEALSRVEAQIPALTESVNGAERELGDWALLERALGKDGAQALEIDAAGPEVARLTNALLESCYGARFSISFETLREKKSARGEFSEAFDVRVYDGGAERPVEALSGGEKVVVGEAIGLAIAILNARKNAVRFETLWRDETAGALDPENASAYVLMLRRARELGGFQQVIFVAHSPEVVEAADVRLVVSNGTVTVEGLRRAA